MVETHALYSRKDCSTYSKGLLSIVERIILYKLTDYFAYSGGMLLTFKQMDLAVSLYAHSTTLTNGSISSIGFRLRAVTNIFQKRSSCEFFK